LARILITWELGGGSGHLVPLAPVASGLAGQGHTLVVAVRDVARAATTFAGIPLRFLQAPFRHGPGANEILPPLTLAHILHNVGYGDELELAALAGAWRELLTHVNPDLMICDHSPTALLASRGLPMRRIVMGSGFICPPDQLFLPNLRFWLKADPNRLARDQDRLLGRMNATLRGLGESHIDRVTQIYADVHATLLTTFKELDHYPSRGPAEYWGAWTVAPGKPPQWPPGTGRRIYAYLKDCPAVPHVLDWLARAGHPTLAYVDGVDRKSLDKIRAPTLRFERERLDMARVAGECDLAILHATHGTTASILIAGKPVMLLPIFLEQGLMGHAVCKLGAGEQAPAFEPERATDELAKVIASDAYAAAAQRFAAKYAGYDSHDANERLLGRIEQVLAQATATLR
jgi:hypothetical protein